jgi:hypothetical protein
VAVAATVLSRRGREPPSAPWLGWGMLPGGLPAVDPLDAV